MATTKENKVNNVNNESAKVSNESAATAKVESNVTANESAKVENESKQEAATEPTSEQIAAAKVEQKHQTEIANRYTLEEPKEVERTKFAGATVLGVWRAPKDVKKNGDKTFFKVYYNGTIYDGYTSTEFCDAVGIERKHRNATTKKEITLLDKLEALKALLDVININDTDFVNFGKIVVTKIESEKLESDRIAFVAKYAAAIALFAEISEATCAKIYGADVLELAKKLGYKFADTKDTKGNESK